jgi:hypothetical protein
MKKMDCAIGWAEMDITPEATVDLWGQYYHRKSQGIHSRLSATAMALEGSNGERVVMVSVDSAGFQPDFQEEVRTVLRSGVPELDGASVFLNATHTHNAPGVDLIRGIGWLTELPDVMPQRTYRKFLVDRIATAVVEAWNNRRAAGIANALGHARVGHCRRAMYANGSAEMYGRTDREDFLGMEGGEDSGVDLLFTFEPGGNPTGAILNLACPSQVMEATYRVSSDFMGETRRRLKERYGQGFRMLGQVSAAGCQSPRDLARGYRGEVDFWHEDGVTEIGRRLLAAVEETFPRAAARIEYHPEVKHAVKKILLPRRRASREDLAASEKILREIGSKMSEEEAYRGFCDEVSRNEKTAGRPGPYDSKLHPFVIVQNNKAVVERYRNQDERPLFEIESHFLRLGNVAIATNPFELYLDFGHQIKARSTAEQTFVVQLCCGEGGYLPTARAELLGGYGGLIINGEVSSAGGKQLVDVSVREVSALWK